MVLLGYASIRRSQHEEKRISLEYENITINGTHIRGPYFHVSVYSGLIGGVFLLELLRALFFFKIAIDSSQKLHNSMLAKILMTNISFFAINQAG